MNNFGVIELASTKTTHAPGWAYVPDVAINASAAHPKNRKRAARNHGAPNQTDVSARQDARIRKELELLDKDVHKDVSIPIPARTGGGGRAQTKSTANVRKILQSQKTFANHLDDYHALLAQAETNPVAAATLASYYAPLPAKASTPAPAPKPTPPPAPVTKRSAAAQKRSDAAAKRAAAKIKLEAEEAEAKTGGAAGDGDGDGDVAMTDAPAGDAPAEQPQTDSTDPVEPAAPTSYPPDGTILPAYQKPPPKAHPMDDDPLLASAIPPFPSDEELVALMTAPPLGYAEAQVEMGEDEGRYPSRAFCEICGYWGRVRCIKCGTRVCALDCLDVHRQECITRYGL